MTTPNPMLAELDEVVRLMRGFDRHRFTAEMERWFRTHHAALADMAKRLEEAEMDSKRLDWLERDCTHVPDEYGMARQLYFGTYSCGQSLREAIDATQEARDEVED